MYRTSQQRNDYESQQWSEIIAHYEIQVKVQRQKLRQMEQFHRKKLQQMQRRIRQQAQERQMMNANITSTNEPLQLEIQSRRRQVEHLTMKLQQLRKSPYTKFLTIDQQLIPSQSYQIEIQQKHKEIRMLQNQLIQAENIFEGKYVIEHKLNNQYEMELKMNKKLSLQLDQYQKVNTNYMNAKNNQKAALINQYKKLTQQIVLEIQALKTKIKTTKSQNNLYSKRTSTQRVKYSNSFDDQRVNSNIQQHFGRIFIKQQPNISQLDKYSNLNPQHHIKVQTLQIQNLQSKMTSILEANQRLLELKSQKQAELQKIKELNQKTDNQRTSAILQNKEITTSKKLETRGTSTMEEQSQKKNKIDFQERKGSQINEQNLQQSEGLLESVIKFFRSYNNTADKKQSQKEPKQVIENEPIQQPRKMPITARDTLASSATIDKIPLSPEQQIQRQESKVKLTTPQQNKYNRFGLEQIYKKNTPKTESYEKN